MQNPQSSRKSLHFSDEVLRSRGNKGARLNFSDPVAQKQSDDRLIQKLRVIAEQPHEGDDYAGALILTKALMLLYPELVLDKGTLPDDSKLPWYLVLRGLMVFLPTLSNAEKSSMIDRITGQCIKSIGLEKKLEASLMMAKGDDFRSFNFEMMHTLHADNPENVILSARNLPKCSLAAASSLFKVLEMSFQVSGLQVLEKARNNLAAALPFLLDCGERHLDCFKVFVTAYFRVSTAAQYAMARNIEMVMPAKDAAEIIEELRRNPNAIHSANHPVAWRLLNAMKTVSVMQCPLTPSAATP